MTSMNKLWVPKTPTLNDAQRAALSVPYSSPQPMQPEILRNLLEQKLDRLIAANPQQARETLEMSNEQAPELWEIAEQSNPSEWGTLLVRSDGFQRLLDQIDWKAEAKKGTNPPRPEPSHLRAMLEQII